MAIIDPWQEEQRVQNAIIDPWQEEKEQPQLSKNKGFAEEFAQGVPRGWHQTKSALYAAGAMASSALGLDETRDSFLKKATEAEAKAQEYPAGTQSFTNIESIYDVPGYIGGLLGEQVTNMGETAITTLAGSLIGSAMGPGGTAAGAAGGILAKATIRNMMTSIAKGLTKQGVEKNLAKSMAEEALTRMPMKNIYRSIGAKAGMVAGTFPLEAGGNYLESYQKGYDNPWSAAATGGAAALLELAGGGSNVIDAIFNPKTMGSGLKLVGQVFGWLGKTAAQEGGQEAGQEFLSVLNEKINDPKGVTVFDKQNLARMLDAAVAGAAVGTIYGGAGAGISATTTNKAQQEAKATDTVRWYLQNTRERFLDEKDPYGTTEMSADLDNLVKASGGFFTEAMKAEEIARMGKQRPIRTKEDAIRTVEDVKQDTTIPPESKNQRIIDLMSMALDLPERGNIPEAITPEAQGRADSIQEAYAELERIRRDVAKEGPTPEDLLLGSREKVEKALKKESPAKTAYDYGKSAFDRGIKSVPSLDAEFMKTLEGREVGASTKDLKEWSRGWQEANLAAPIPEKGEKKQGAQEIVREEVEAVAATPKGKKGKKQAAIAPEPAQEEVRRTIEEAQKKLQGQKEALQQGVTVPPGIDNFDSYLIASGIDPIELGKKLKEEKAIGQSATDKEGSATFQAVKLTREWEAYVNNGHKAPESTKEVTEHGEEMQGQTEEPEGQEVAPPGEVTPGAEVLKGYPELTTTGKTTEEAPKKEPKTKEAKPKSLLRIVQEHGGLDRKATQAGYQDTEGLKSISFAFTNKREKGSGIMDPGDLATELQGLGLLGPTPDTVSGPGEWLIQQLLDERRRKRDNITEDKQDELERAAEQQVIEDLRADGRSESEIAEILGTVQEDIAAPISDEELSARAAADREIESLKSELIVSEEEDEEEQPSAPPPQDQQKAERDRIARDVEGKLFDDSGAFSLSGQQPVVQKTMQTQEKKGERILDVKKADTNELYERLKGKKQGDIGQSYGVISPEWDSLDIDDTIRSYWKTKLEAEYGRTNEENRGPGIADDPRKIRDHGLSFPSGEELGRLLDRQIAKTRGRADSKWFESVVLDLGIRNTPEFRLAERHFASFGYTLIPIGEVAWGGAVNHADKVAYLSNVTGDAFAYFMSHETSHILSNQGNKAVLAIKDNIDTGHPVFVDVSGNLGMGDNFALEELTAAIVGGMDSYLAILQGPKEVSDKNVKSARRASLEGDGDKTPLFRKAPVFYSQLLRTVEAKINDMPAKAQSIVGWLIKNQVKPMEIEEIGLEGWLKENRRPNIVKVEPSKDGVIGDKIFTFSDGARLEARDEDHAVEEYRYDRGKEPPLSDRIDKQALLDFIRANQIEFKEVEKGDRKGFDTWLADKGYGTDNISLNSMTAEEYERLQDQYFEEQESDSGDTKFSSYILPGGSNYREVLVTVPSKVVLKRDPDYPNVMLKDTSMGEDYVSPHWSEPNVIGHLRMQVFTDEEGNKVLLVEEVQSDWHQEGKKKGYATPEIEDRIKTLHDKGADATIEERNELYELQGSAYGRVPNAPLKESWHEMLMKRALRYAVEGGYDKIAWTTGTQQAERYDLSKQVDSIDVIHNGYPGAEGTYDITAEKDGHVVVTQQRVSKNSLPDLIGKDLAKKAISETEQPGTSATYSGLDLKIGGKGMAVFYDQKIPAFMQKYVKPWGGKVGGTDISFEDRIPNKPGEPYGWNDMVRHYTVHSISITPAMRDAVMQGQPLYRATTSSDLPTLKAPTKQRFTVRQVEKFIERIVSKLRNAGAVKVLNSVSDLDADVAMRSRAFEYAQQGETVFGFYDPKTDTTYIFADSISSEKAARVILIHEVVGHRGARAILNATERKVLEKSVLEAYKGSTILNQVVGNYDLDLTKESDRETALDELVAHIAETKDIPTLWSKIVRLVKLALARLGLSSYKETDVERLIQGAFRYAEGKGRPFSGAVTGEESFRKVPLSPDNIVRAVQWHLTRAQQDFDAAKEMRNWWYKPTKPGQMSRSRFNPREWTKKDAEHAYEKAKSRLDIVRQLSDALEEYGPQEVYGQVREFLPGWKTNLEETINYLANGKKREVFFRKIMPSKKGPGKPTETVPAAQPEGGNPFKDSVVQEPVYHGTRALPFDVFNTEYGAFFSPSKKMAQSYTKLRESQVLATGIQKGKPRIIGAYLDIKNPLDLSVFGNEESIFGSRAGWMGYWETTGTKLRKLLKNPTDEKLLHAVKAVDGFNEKLLHNLYHDDPAIYAALEIFRVGEAEKFSFGGNPHAIISAFRYEIKKGSEVMHERLDKGVKTFLESLGFDGVIFNDDAVGTLGNQAQEKAIVAFYPHQIKIDPDLPNPSRPPGEGGQTPLLRKALPFKDRFHEEVDDISAILKAKTNQPLSFAERMLRSPEWFGHQVFKDLVKIFTRTRKELYHNYFNAFVGSGDEDAVKALADLKNKGMSLSDRMKGHTSKEYQLLEQMTDEADRNNVKTRQAEEVWRSRNYPEEVVDVWRTVRESYDRQLDALIQPLKEYLEEIALDSFALDKETPARGWYYVAPKEDFDRFITLTPDKAEGRGFVSEPGVNYILGAKGESGGKYTVQAISFDMNVFTKERAARWFADHITDFKMSPINTNYELMNTLQGALTSMNKWRGSYAPRIRPDGEWAVVGTRGEGDEKERFRTHGSHRQMLKLSRDMEKDGWVVRVEHVNKLPESVYQDIKTAAVANAIDNAVQGLQGTDTFRAQILQNAADMIRARGFRSAMIHRKTGQAVSGYITDPMERLLRYTNNNAGGMSKAEVSRQATEVLLGKYIPTERDEEGKVITRAHREGGVDPAKDPQLYDAATDYIREQLRNVEHSDKVIGLAKSIATFKYLGFNPRSLVVNMTALATTVPPSIVQYGTDGKASFAEVLRELPKAMKDYVSFMAGKPLSDAKDQAFLDAIKKAGDTDAQMVRDATGQLHGVIHKGAQKAMDIAMIGFSKSEELNRGATMLAAYRLAQKHGFSEEQAQEKAKDASDKAHGVYGKGTLPLWAIGNNPAAKIGQMLYVYSKFGHNYVQMLYDLGFTNTNIKAFVWALAAPVVLAGGAATPFKDELLALLQAILRALGYTGNLERDMWASVRNHLGKGAEKVARYGIAGQLGVDITGSLSVGVGIPKGLWDLTGAPGAVWEDIATAYRFASRGKVGRAIEKGALPTGLANVPRAFREKAEGITTEQGRRVWDERGRPYVPSATETGLRVAGFGSSDESVVKARTWESKKAELSFKDRRDAIYEELRAYYSNPNRKTSDYQDIMKKVVKYNKAVRESGMGRAEVPPITTESIRRQRAGVSRPQKKDIERLRDMPL